MNKTEVCSMIEKRLKVKIGEPFFIKNESNKYIIETETLDIRYSKPEDNNFYGRSIHTLGELLLNPDMITKNISPIETHGLLYAFLAGYRYVARDKNDALYFYPTKPHKHSLGMYWASGDSNTIYLPNIELPFISWKDKEPTKIADLLLMCGKNPDEIRN